MTIYEGVNVVSSPYGWRMHPISGQKKHHNGKDIVGKTSKKQRLVVEKGRVLQVNTGHWAGRGNNVLIESQDDRQRPGSRVLLRYQHQSSTALKVGQVLRLGDVVGTEGRSGDSTGSHCHFEVTVNGVVVDPSPWDKLPNVAGSYVGWMEKTVQNEQSKMLLHSFGCKNMQGFSKRLNNESALVYDKMPVGYRVATRLWEKGEEGCGWRWVEVVDERTGEVLYTPLLEDRNKLIKEPGLLLPERAWDEVLKVINGSKKGE